MQPTCVAGERTLLLQSRWFESYRSTSIKRTKELVSLSERNTFLSVSDLSLISREFHAMMIPIALEVSTGMIFVEIDEFENVIVTLSMKFIILLTNIDTRERVA